MVLYLRNHNVAIAIFSREEPKKGPKYTREPIFIHKCRSESFRNCSRAYQEVSFLLDMKHEDEEISWEMGLLFIHIGRRYTTFNIHTVCPSNLLVQSNHLFSRFHPLLPSRPPNGISRRDSPLERRGRRKPKSLLFSRPFSFAA